jgi:hypothetical protein
MTMVFPASYTYNGVSGGHGAGVHGDVAWASVVTWWVSGRQW